MLEGHDENEMTEEHEHGPFCFSHAEHWRDDSVYAHPEFDPEDSPTAKDLIELLSEGMDMDTRIYRFALAYVDENGTIQVAGNPGMTPMSMVNLLSNTIRILSFQESALEAAAQNIVTRGIGTALKAAMAGEGEMPDVSAILGGIPAKPRKAKKGKHAHKDDMREGYL